MNHGRRPSEVGAFAKRLRGSIGGQALSIFALKLATMALGLFSIQLTASLFSKETFLLLNSILFLIAIHGCINYSVQVMTWREGGINLGTFGIVHAVTLVIAISFTLAKGGNWILLLSVFCYLAYRGNERILFNLQITRGQVNYAYGVIFLALAIETSVAVALYMGFGARADRFVLPSLSALALTIPCTLSLLYRGRSDISRALFADKRGMFLVSAHSGLIALNVMSDRLVFSTGISSIKDHLSDYLLVFSYCTSAYALIISLLEVRRPALFKIQANSLTDFLRLGEFSKFSIISLGTTIFSGAGIYIGITIFLKISGISPNAPAFLFVIFLSLFFLGQALLSFIHVYCLSERLYSLLFITWAISGVVRLAGYLQSDWTSFLAITAFSGFAAMGAAFLLGRRYAA